MHNPSDPKRRKPQSPNISPLARLRNHLIDRDRLILSWLYDHHTLTTAQIAHALFPSLDYAQRRLKILTGLQAITRFRPNKLDGGSYPYHYVLDQLGFVYVMGERQAGWPRRDEARRRLQSVMTRPDLRHLLGVNQLFTDLAGHARVTEAAALEAWRPAADFHTPVTLLRMGDSLYMSASSGVRLPRPDGAGVWRQDGRAVPFWVEYDTGTERLDILTEKIFKYETLATSAQWAWPALFVLPSQRREDNLHNEIGFYRQPPKALWFTTNSELLTLSGSPAGRVWRAGGVLHHLGVLALIDLPYLDAAHDQRYQVTNPRRWNDKPGLEPDDDE